MVDDFLPSVLLDVAWPQSKHKSKTASLGNTIKPKKLQGRPLIHIHPDQNSNLPYPWPVEMPFTVILTDPDAPSRENPKWSEFCHWIITGIPATPSFPIVVSTSSSSSPPFSPWTSSSTSSSSSLSSFHSPVSDNALDLDEAEVETDDNFKIREIVPYHPPGPPPKTGKHRYVFLALTPVNATTEGLNLTTPAGRQHWGYDGYGGVREWAVENGLRVVGGNFVYAKND